MKMKFFPLMILFLFNLNCLIHPQATFKEFFRLSLNNPNQSLVKIQLVDFNDDGNEEVIVVMKDSLSWNISIFDSLGLIRYNEWTIAENEDIQQAIIFLNNDSLYIASAFYLDPDFSGKILLRIYNLKDFDLISESEKPIFYNNIITHFEINSLYTELVGDTSLFYLGYTTNEFEDGPGVFVYEDNSYMYVYSFSDSVKYVKMINECANICLVNRLGFGRYAIYIDGATSSSLSRVTLKKIYYVNGTIFTEEVLRLTNENSSGAYRYFREMTSCDYSDTIFGSVFSYNLLGSGFGYKKYFCFSPDFTTILWESDSTYMPMYYKIIASSNLEVDGQKNFIIYFNNNYRMEIRNRINGEIKHSEWTSINPFMILMNHIGENVYFCKEPQYIVAYYMEDLNFIINSILTPQYKSSLFQLHSNYPNPFNPSTSIQYAISGRQFVNLKVYDVLGKEVATLVNEEKPAGNYEVEFNGTGLPSGIYFYQLRTGSYVETKKMVFLK